ncbi:MAG: GNAT family N-acetyltransferase [Bacteriovoracaceae bacterium]
MKLVRLDETLHNIGLVQKLFENTPTYFLNVSGEIAGQGEGEEAFKALPSNFPREDKHVLGISFEEKFIGVIDCLIGYPSKEKAHIGLLLIGESGQSQGFGKLAYLQLEEYLKRFRSISTIRLSVVESNNEVLAFWEKMGFQRTGEVRPYSNMQIQSNSFIMEKKIVRV